MEEPETKLSNASCHKLTENAFSKILVPSDGNCLFWAVTMAYLLPVRNDERLFDERCARLFGLGSENQKLLVRELIGNNDFNYVYEDETLIEFVTERLRNRVVDEMMKQEEEVYQSVSLNDFLYTQNATFITEGSFAQLFQSAFPSQIHIVDLNKLNPSQLNQTTIETLNEELNKITQNESIKKFKFECYCKAMRSRKSFAGEREIQAIKRMLKCQIFIFNDHNKRLILQPNVLTLCLFNNNDIHFEFGLIKAEFIYNFVNKECQTVSALLNFGVDKIIFPDQILQHLPASTDNYYHAIIKKLTARGVDVNVEINELNPLKKFATETNVNTNNIKEFNNNVIREQQNVLHNHLGQTILHAAIEDNNLRIVKQILENSDQSSLLNAPTIDDKKQTALHLAVLNNNLEIVQYLIEKKADVNVKDFNMEMNEKSPNWSPLHYAAEKGYLGIAKVLVENGRADVNIKDYSRGSALQRAVRFGHLKIVKYLVERRANVNSKDKTLVSVLSHAARLGFDHIVHYLMVKGAKINAVDQRRMTAVHHAAKCERWNTVKWLVENGADLNIKNDGNKTTLSRVVEAGKWDVVGYLLNNNALLIGLSEKNKGQIFDKFIGENNLEEQIYRAIKLGNVEILELLITKIINKDDEKLQEVISVAYEKLKLQNVVLNQNMRVYLEDKLINFRFFSENEMKIKGNSKENFDMKVIRERLKLVIDCVDQLTSLDKNGEISEEYLYIGKFVAKNMQILKRQLFFTYDQLPWEEMQFCLLAFISSYVNPTQIEIINKLVMHREKLNSHLISFKLKLEELEKSLNNNFVIDKKKFAREKCVENIVKNNPEFRQLYEDYEILKDVYSLKKIENHIKIAGLVNIKSQPVIGQLVIERALQVIGECLKNTVESPNMSESVQNALIENAPLNMKGILTSLRDSLSHVETLTKKEELSQNDAHFFPQIQNDLKKLETEITYILYNKKIQAFKRCLEEILKCENINRVREILSGIEMNEKVVILSGQRFHQTFYRVESLMKDFESLIEEKTEHQIQCFRDISELLEKNKERIHRVQNIHAQTIHLINSLISLIKSNCCLENIKKRIRGFLSTIELEIYELRFYEYVLELIVDIFNDCVFKPNIKIINEMFYQIFSTIEFGCKKIKNIDRFKFSFEKIAVENDEDKNEKNRDKILKKIDSKFSIFVGKLSKLELGNLFREEYENKKIVHRAKISLIEFYDGKNNTGIDLNTCTELMKEINLKLSKNESYLSLNEENDFLRRQKLIQRINRSANDSYGKLIKKLTNEPDNAFMQNAFVEFIKSFVSAKKLESNFLEINEKLFCDVEIYFQKLKILEYIFDSEKNDVELINLMRGNNDTRVAVEMLTLTLTEILENLSLFETNPLFLDEHTPLLIGKNLRNYLAHGDLLMEVLSIDHLQSIVSHYHILKQNCDVKTKSVYVKNELIGKPTLENISKLRSDYESNLQLIKKQNKMFTNVKLIIDKNVSNQNLEIIRRKSNNWTFLNSATKTDNLQLFKYLLKNNLNIYQKDVFSNTILYYLPQFGSKKIFKFILKHFKIDINLRMYLGRTMLHLAAQFNRNDFVDFLIINRANIEAVDDNGVTPIHYAAVNGHSPVVLTLLKAGANVETTNTNDESLLHLSAMGGHLDVIKSLTDIGGSVNRLDVDNRTPLHFACINGHENVIHLLIENGADVNAKSSDGGTPVHFAAQDGHEKIVEILIANHANVNSLAEFKNTALHMAAFKGFEKIIPILIKNGADVNAKNDKDLTALHAASILGHHEVIKTLLENGADVNIITTDDVNSLHLAAEYDHPRAVKILLEYKSSVNARTKNGRTPLHLIAEIGNVEIIETLLNFQAEINAVNNFGRTALHTAVLHNKLEAVETLISRGAEIGAADNDERTPLFVAALTGNLQIFQLLLKNNRADLVNKKYKNGWTALHVAAQQGHKKIVEFLISDKKVEINCGNNLGATPLHLAAQNGHFEAVKTLLENKAEVNLTDSIQWTALHYASTNGQYKVVRLLLNNKARIDLFSADGFSAWHLAAKYGHKDVLEVLISDTKMVDARTTDSKKSTALHFAAGLGHSQAAEFLLDRGADINAKSDTNWTALHLAVKNGHSNVVELLFCPRKKAEVNAKLLNGCTPLHLAAQNGHDVAAYILLFYGADVNATYDTAKITPLHEAAEMGNVNMVVTLVKHGAHVNCVDKNLKTPLHWAAANGRAEVVAILSGYKANVNAKDAKNWTPLHVAAENGRFEFLIKIVSYGADIYALGDNNCTPLHLSCQNGHFNAVRVILTLDKSLVLLNKVNSKGESALQLAAEVGDAEIVQLLMDRKADIDYAEPSLGWTALHCAANGNDAETVECLIKNNAELEIKSVDGATPLHLAAMNGQEEIVKILCAAGAHVNSLTNENNTALHLAADKNHVSVANILIKAGANVNATKNDGATPLHIAAAMGHLEMVELLAEAGAEIDAKAQSRLTPLHMAAQNAHSDIISLLLNKGANVNQTFVGGFTALHWAVQYGHSNAVETLLSFGANVNAKNSNNVSPLHIAVKLGRLEIARALIEKEADVFALDDHDSVLHKAVRDEKMLEFILKKIEKKANGNDERLKTVVNARDGEGDTPLMWAAQDGYLNAVKLLLKCRVIDVDERNFDGWTALNLAAQNGHRGVVELLIESQANVDGNK